MRPQENELILLRRKVETSDLLLARIENLKIGSIFGILRRRGQKDDLVGERAGHDREGEVDQAEEPGDPGPVPFPNHPARQLHLFLTIHPEVFLVKKRRFKGRLDQPGSPLRDRDRLHR